MVGFILIDLFLVWSIFLYFCDRKIFNLTKNFIIFLKNRLKLVENQKLVDLLNQFYIFEIN